MQDFFKDYTAIFETKVAWGEMDAALHVNNTVFLRYSESARIEFFRELDFEVHVHNPSRPIGPILAEVYCKYKAPLTYPDTITIASRVDPASIDAYSFWMEQIIFSHKLQRIAAEIRTRIVSYDYIQLKKAPIWEELRVKLMTK
ncbi:MAG: thioesterase family protein [Microscillaceae bacterium]|nr:thioesterase family protein [Microscillaceae bacterium]